MRKFKSNPNTMRVPCFFRSCKKSKERLVKHEIVTQKNHLGIQSQAIIVSQIPMGGAKSFFNSSNEVQRLS